MALSYDLISQFAKLTKSSAPTNTESTVYGVVQEIDEDGTAYVKLDGSDQLVPVLSVANANVGEKVTVLIGNHTATLTGNIDSPAARTGDVEELGDDIAKIQEFDILIGEKVQANDAYIKELQTDKASVGELIAATARITELEANDVTINGKLTAAQADITDLKTTKLDAEVADLKFATIEKLDAVTAEIDDLEAKNLEVTDKLTAAEADIDDLEVKKLDATWVNIDYANIDKAILEEFYSSTGLIRDVTIGDATITGELVGVTIRGDLIKAGTLVADKLVIKGEDGLYYALNTAGRTSDPVKYIVTYDSASGEYIPTTDTTDVAEGTLIEGAYTTDGKEVYVATSDGVDLYFYIEEGHLITEVKELELIQTDENSLDGSIITAKSITASKIAVTDLVAFGATIGGFKITDNAIHSQGKESVDSALQGFYVDNDGQFAVGDNKNYLIYHKETSYFNVTYDSDTEEYTDTQEEIDPIEGTLVEGVYTVDNKPVYITSSGLYFCTSDIYKLAVAAESVSFNLNSTLKDLSDRIDIGTYEDPETGETQPSIELSDSDEGGTNKQILTSTKTVFTEDDVVRTKVDVNGVTGDNIVTNKEFRHNNTEQTGSYVWAFRSNGNYGLRWEEATS